MNANELTTVEQLIKFLDGTQAVGFSVEGNKKSRYAWIQKTLVQFHYIMLRKDAKGVVKKYVKKITGCSSAQLTRLVVSFR